MNCIGEYQNLPHTKNYKNLQIEAIKIRIELYISDGNWTSVQKELKSINHL